MAKVRINKMTVPELVTYCKEQRQGESCPEDCALRKLGCSKFLPALWDVEGRRRDEQREDAVDMVRHLIAAHGIYPEEAFPGLPEVEPPKDKRVPNWLKDAIGKETSAPEETAVCAAESLTESECVWADETESEAATAAETASAEPSAAELAEEILNAGKDKPPKRRGRPPRKASE